MNHKILIGLLLFTFASLQSKSQLLFDLEGNYIASVPYNSVRIPAQGGTAFDLSKELHRKSDFTYRLRGSITLGKRHELSVLYAPLVIRSSGTFSRPVAYNGHVFPASVSVEAKYKFNSYRLTYRYKLVNNERWVLAIGISAKIRDAGITLENDSISSEYPNIGFVPLIHFFASWQFINNVRLVIEGDALGTNQGRAEDIFAGLYVSVLKNIAIKGGYRVLEGGANGERTYNFTWVNYAALGIVVKI